MSKSEKPLLELKKTNKQIARLELTKARAASRVKRRIIQQLEEEELQKLEQQVVSGEKPVEEVAEFTGKTNEKKGDK
jgi:hypothetical protein